MFDNIGDKLKGVAIVSCALGVLASLIGGIAMMVGGAVLIGILTIVLGALLSWVSCLGLYGFGQLIENSDTLVAKLGGNAGAAAGNAAMPYQAASETIEMKAASSWQCTCGAKNPMTVDYCLSCRRSREEAVKIIKCPSSGANNKETNDKCFVCGKELH